MCLDLGKNGKEATSKGNLVIKLSSIITHRTANEKTSKFLGKKRFNYVWETKISNLITQNMMPIIEIISLIHLLH